MKTRLLGFTIPMILAACSLAPVYRVPSTAAIPDGFKEAPGWRVATPADGASRGTWWSLLGDPMLDSLEARALVSNQNLAAAKAAYDSARALVREQRAAYLPTVGLNANANRPGTFADRGSSTVNTSSSARYVMSLGASWEPDLWGRIGNMVSEAGASAAASGADLASATLSVQGELALNYVQLRGIEAQQVILAATLSDYEKAVTITTNRYDAGVVARSDVLQAETALQLPMVLAEPRPLAPIVNFGQFSIDYIVLAWVSDAKDRALVASELRMTYWNALKAHGIEVPYPQSDIHVRSGALEG